MQSVHITFNVVVRIPFRRDVLYTTLCDKGWWFSPGTPVSSTNKTDRHYIPEILLKVALNNITLTPLENVWTLCRDEHLAFCNGHNAPTRYWIGEFSMGAVIYQSPPLTLIYIYLLHDRFSDGCQCSFSFSCVVFGWGGCCLITYFIWASWMKWRCVVWSFIVLFHLIFLF